MRRARAARRRRMRTRVAPTPLILSRFKIARGEARVSGADANPAGRSLIGVMRIAIRSRSRNSRASARPGRSLCTSSVRVCVPDVLRYFGVIAFDFRQDLAADVFDVILVRYRHIDLDSVMVVEFDGLDV
jgi:hypothetical protein